MHPAFRFVEQQPRDELIDTSESVSTDDIFLRTIDLSCNRIKIYSYIISVRSEFFFTICVAQNIFQLRDKISSEFCFSRSIWNRREKSAELNAN